MLLPPSLNIGRTVKVFKKVLRNRSHVVRVDSRFSNYVLVAYSTEKYTCRSLSLEFQLLNVATLSYVSGQFSGFSNDDLRMVGGSLRCCSTMAALRLPLWLLTRP